MLYPVNKKLDRPNKPKQFKNAKMCQVVKRPKIQNRRSLWGWIFYFSLKVFCTGPVHNQNKSLFFFKLNYLNYFEVIFLFLTPRLQAEIVTQRLHRGIIFESSLRVVQMFWNFQEIHIWLWIGTQKRINFFWSARLDPHPSKFWLGAAKNFVIGFTGFDAEKN